MSRVNENGWKELDAQQRNLQPTPPVGFNVVWYPAGNVNDPVAGQVTGVEGPGRLKLVVFPKNAFPAHKNGVYHVSAKIHDKPGNPTTKNWGSWDYVQADDMLDAHFKLHRQELAKLEENLTRGEEDAKRAAEDYAEKQAAKKVVTGKKKPIHDPLPAPA